MSTRTKKSVFLGLCISCAIDLHVKEGVGFCCRFSWTQCVYTGCLLRAFSWNQVSWKLVKPFQHRQHAESPPPLPHFGWLVGAVSPTTLEDGPEEIGSPASSLASFSLFQSTCTDFYVHILAPVTLCLIWETLQTHCTLSAMWDCTQKNLPRSIKACITNWTAAKTLNDFFPVVSTTKQ